jgi:hypothetical protein
VNLLDPGFEFQQFDPKQPTQSHAEFANSMLHTLAAAMGVTGFLAGGQYVRGQFLVRPRRFGRGTRGLEIAANALWPNVVP